MAILQDLSREDMMARIAALEAKLATSRKVQALSFKITDGGKEGTGSVGALSVRGLGRFPVTLYKSQWLRLLDAADDLRAFISAHADELATKD